MFILLYCFFRDVVFYDKKCYCGGLFSLRSAASTIPACVSTCYGSERGLSQSRARTLKTIAKVNKRTFLTFKHVKYSEW